MFITRLTEHSVVKPMKWQLLPKGYKNFSMKLKSPICQQNAKSFLRLHIAIQHVNYTFSNQSLAQHLISSTVLGFGGIYHILIGPETGLKPLLIG